MTPIAINLIILTVLVLFVISIYNRLVQLRVRAKEALSDIDVQLKRRYDLIPNLDDLFPKIREEEVGWYIYGLLSEAVEKKEQERANRAKLLRVPDDELIEKYAAWAGGSPNDLEKR